MPKPKPELKPSDLCKYFESTPSFASVSFYQVRIAANILIGIAHRSDMVQQFIQTFRQTLFKRLAFQPDSLAEFFARINKRQEVPGNAQDNCDNGKNNT